MRTQKKIVKYSTKAIVEGMQDREMEIMVYMLRSSYVYNVIN